MSEPASEMTFMMGKFAAVLPGDRRYARNHMWCQAVDGRLRFGFTSYAVRLMQDVYFLDWSISPGDARRATAADRPHRNLQGGRRSVRPDQGRLVGFNQQLLKDPSPINVDSYAAGWLFEMEGDPRRHA